MGMSNEPERPIEQSLRAYAAKRRWDAGDPMEMPEETRRLLRLEVAQRFAQSAPRRYAWKTLLSGLWPRFALGAGLAALVIAGAIWFGPFGRDRGAKAPSLAGNRANGGTVLAERLRAVRQPSLPVPQPSSSPQGRALAGPAQTALVLRQLVSSKGLASSVSMNSFSMKTGLPPESVGKPLVRLSLPPGTTAPVAPVLADASVAASGMAGAEAGQRFLRVEPTVFKLARGSSGGISPDQGVLSSFRIEQTGPQLRIIDHDGSVYTGLLRNEEPAMLATSYGGFRVAGTNRSLNQRVVFSGEFMPLIKPPAPPRTNLFPNVAVDRVGGLAFSGTATNGPVALSLVTAPGAPPIQLGGPSGSNLSLRYGLNPALDRKIGVWNASVLNVWRLRHSEISGKLTVGKHKPVGIHAVPMGTPAGAP